MQKKMFVFVESLGEITKVELPQDFDGNLGNFIAKIAVKYGENTIYYVGGLA